MSLADVTRWALVCALVLGIPVASRLPRHRPLVALLAWGMISDLMIRDHLAPALASAQASVRAAGGDPLAAPLEGWGRVAGHAYQALSLSWPAGVAAVGLAVFARRRAWVPVVAWIVAVLVLVIGYPLGLRGTAVRPVYIGAEILGIAVGLGAFVGWARRRLSPRSHHVAALALVALEVPVVRGYLPTSWTKWDLARVALLVLFSSLALMFGGLLWNTRSRSSSGC